MPDFVRDFAVGERDLVVAAAGGRGRILSLRKSNGAVRVLATGQEAWSVGVNRSHVYWVTGDEVIRRVAVDGGAIEDVAKLGRLTSLAVDDSGVYWTDDQHILHFGRDGKRVVLAQAHVLLDELVLDAQAIYWVDRCSGGIFTVAKSGGEPTQLTSYPRDGSGCVAREPGPVACQYICSVLAVDDTHVYWPDDERILRVAKTGGPVHVVLTGHFATSIAVDDTWLYVTTTKKPVAVWAMPAGEVMAFDKRRSKAAPIVLAVDGGLTEGVTVDAQRVYWRAVWVRARVRPR